MTQSHPSAPRRKVTFTAPITVSQLQQIQIHTAPRCPIFTMAHVTTTVHYHTSQASVALIDSLFCLFCNHRKSCFVICILKRSDYAEPVE